MDRSDELLRDTLKKAYQARAKLFVERLRKSGIAELIVFLQQQRVNEDDWDRSTLAISDSAFEKVQAAGVEPHLVFCHPIILALNKSSIHYFRNLAALSKKGFHQMVAGLRGHQRLQEQCRIINGILSALVENTPAFDLALAQSVIPAEIGAEAQGTWVNMIGKGAASRVQALITEYANLKKIVASIDEQKVEISGKKRTQRCIVLKSGWTIVFADEPDVAIRDKKRVLRAAIEIKGSMDKAGAQTRYGEAKKSFGKALHEHGQCETIYLASCFTAAVERQIKADAQVRKVFNLIDVFEDPTKRDEFLRELFVHQIRIIKG